MAISLVDLATDLAAESADVLQMLAPLSESDWDRWTPAQGWNIRDQVSHLAFFDERTTAAISDPVAFRATRPETPAGIQELVDSVAARCRSRSGDDLRAWFESERSRLLSEVSRRDGSDRVPWYGPDMSIASMLTARIMETWAHGQDIADAAGVERRPTSRLRHVVFLGLQAAANSFRSRGLDVPTDPILVRVTAPDGDLWSFGPDDANDTVTGSALGLAMVVTQRRNVADTDVRAIGESAQAWLDVAQAFAGPPTPARPPMGRESAGE